MPARIKICGLSTPDTLDAAIGADAGDLGFVFFPPSPRNLDFERAAALAARVPDHVGRVGVFVDADDEFVDRAVAVARLTALQLHGSETPERVAALRARTGLGIWKAIQVRTRADLAVGNAYHGAADLLLFDAKPPKGADLPGGLGLRFDWQLLVGHDPRMAWGLSGGLDAANIAEAIAVSGARLVDVSSGVEDAPGVKSIDRIKAFCRAVRQA
jgi:phosphoribosylanthranilate isomerase